MRKLYTFLLCSAITTSAAFGQTYHSLKSGALLQNWSNTGMITIDDNWSNVPSIIGYRGDNLTTSTGVDPQTILTPGMDVIDVVANLADPNTYTSGAVAEFDQIANPTIAFQGSGTADAPFIVVFVDASEMSSIRFKCNLRDIDGSTDNSVQAVAFQYRTSLSSDFINIPAAFVADASSGPSLATLVTAVDFTLPAACDNQAILQIRVITTNAPNVDEFIGIDDIEISGTPSTLPIKLFSFLGNSSNGKANLSWKAETTSDVAFFTVETSTDGQSFISIGNVKATGRGLDTYHFIDPGAGTKYYRLKMTEETGNIFYSKVVKIELGRSAKIATNVYYNKAAGAIALSLTNGSTENLQMTLVNQQGQVLASRNATPLAGSISWNVGQMPAGKYFVVITQGKTRETAAVLTQ